MVIALFCRFLMNNLKDETRSGTIAIIIIPRDRDRSSIRKQSLKPNTGTHLALRLFSSSTTTSARLVPPPFALCRIIVSLLPTKVLTFGLGKR
jgi:hypothetical protein